MSDALPRCTEVSRKGAAHGTKVLPQYVISLTYEARLLRRRRMETDSGRAFLLDLPEVVSLNSGDVFVLDDGTGVLVEAAPEPVLRITGDLVRLAWHIGNRHTPCQIEADHLVIRDDPVIARMLEQLGAEVKREDAAFKPEGGAYGHGRTFGHSHGPADHAGAHTHEH